MSSKKKNLSGNDSLNGGKGSDTLAGELGNDKLRGKGGDDVLWGDKTDGSQGGSDTFIFERTRAENGLDTIMDYWWTEEGTDGKGQDVLDLTAALKSFKEALEDDPDADIADYVWLEEGTGGMKLMVDQDGEGGNEAEQWAFLNGLDAEDAVRIRAFSVSCSGSGSGSGHDLGDGYYTLGGEEQPDTTQIFIISENDTLHAYIDTNDDGKLGTGDLRVGYDDGGTWTWDPSVDLGNGAYTLQFLAIHNEGAPVDLAGFGADDFLVFNYNPGSIVTAATVSLTTTTGGAKTTFQASNLARGWRTSINFAFTKTSISEKTTTLFKGFYSGAKRLGGTATMISGVSVNINYPGYTHKILMTYVLPKTGATSMILASWAAGTAAITGAQVSVVWPTTIV